MAEEFDQHSHDQMWHRFTKLMTYGVVGTAILLILMAIFLL